MKLKASEIVLIIAAVAVIGLLGYNLMNTGCAPEETTEEAIEESTEHSTRATEVSNVSSEFSDDPETLRKQLASADKDKVLRFMRFVLDKKLPDDYNFPDFLLEAGSAKESVRIIGERYPEFYKKGGNALVDAARQHPVRYMAMIEESRAYRELYRPTSEVEAEEQARKAEAMRKELAKEKEGEAVESE